MEMMFPDLMKKKNDSELEDYLTNVMAYDGEIIVAAVSELRSRGRIFTPEELAALETKIRERKNSVGKSTITVRTPWEKEIVENENAVSIYSRKTIDWTTLIFGLIPGAVIMFLNLIKTDKKRGIIPLLIFTIIYLLIEAYVFTFIENNDAELLSPSRLLFNGIGALVIHTLFWNFYIGKNFKYRKKKIWFPIVLGIGLNALILFLLLTPYN